MSFNETLDKILDKYNSLSDLMCTNLSGEEFVKISKEFSTLENVVAKIKKYNFSVKEISDLKEIITLKIGTIYYDQIPFWKERIYSNAMGIVTLETLRRDYKYYRFAGKYYLLPEDNADGETHTIHYYKRVVKVVSGGTFLIPDEYGEALTAFAEARYWTSITQQTKAQVPFQEFEQVIQQMEKEHVMRGGSGSILDPQDAENFG